VSESQIRTIIRTFKNKLSTEIFPGREEVPKTLIFAKDDTHAEDIVEIVRQEFGKGNQFLQKDYLSHHWGETRGLNRQLPQFL
jgi:type I restriction enzyme R subunit